MKNLCDHKVWVLPYYMINVSGNESDIHVHHREKPTKNNFKIGDCVGFNHDGKHCIGTINRLNHKTASLITRDNKHWRVGYGLLFKVFDGEQATQTPDGLNEVGNLIIHKTHAD